MMSLEAIRHVNQQIALEAAEQTLVPYVPSNVEEVDYYPPFRFPNLGCSYVPDDWERTETSWFVDKTGHGYDWEPALSVEQFKRELRRYVAEHPGHGFGIIEEGECQAVVAAFQPVLQEAHAT